MPKERKKVRGQRTFLHSVFSRSSLCAMGGKALAAVDRAVASGLEGNLSGLSAGSADDIKHFPRTVGTAGLPGLTAGFAAGGLILEAFFRVEFLLSCGENEFRSAVFAHQCFVFVHVPGTPNILVKYGDSFG